MVIANDNEQITRLVKEIKHNLAPSTHRAFAAGKYLHDLSGRIKSDQHLRASIKQEASRGEGGEDSKLQTLIKKASIKGRGWASLSNFMKLYRLYSKSSQETMGKLNELEDAAASALGDKLYDGTVPPDGELDPKNLRMKLDDALALAQRGYKAKVLRMLIEAGITDIGPFTKESEIQQWFKKSEVQQQLGIKNWFSEVAAGRALRDIDFIAVKEDNLKDIVLVELKLVATFESVGQVLGQINEFVGRSNGHEAKIYAKPKGAIGRYDDANATLLEFQSVEGWLIAQGFHPSAYFAAMGMGQENIYFYRITSDGRFSDPVHAKTMTHIDWKKLGGMDLGL